MENAERQFTVVARRTFRFFLKNIFVLPPVQFPCRFPAFLPCVSPDTYLRLILADYPQQDGAAKEEGVPVRAHITCYVSSTILDLWEVQVDAIETSTGSLIFRTDALWNQGGAERRPGALFALDLPFSAVIGKEDVQTKKWAPDETLSGPARLKYARGNWAAAGSPLGADVPDLRFEAGVLTYKGRKAQIKFIKAPVDQEPPPPVTVTYADDGLVTITNVVGGDKFVVELLDEKRTMSVAADYVKICEIVLKDSRTVPAQVIYYDPDDYEKSVAWITDDAEMPQLVVEFKPAVADKRIAWQLEITYKRSQRNDSDTFPTATPRILPATQPWNIYQDWGTELGALGQQVPVIRGGEAILKFDLEGIGKGEYPFHIRGKNPTVDKIRAYASGKPWYLLAIAKSETNPSEEDPSRMQHFNQSPRSRFGVGPSDTKFTPIEHDKANGTGS